MGGKIALKNPFFYKVFKGVSGTFANPKKNEN